MIELENLSVSCSNIEYLTINWTIADTTESLDDYEIIILRSGSPDSGFIELDSISPSDYLYDDYAANLRSDWRKFHYKLKVINTVTEDEEDFGPVSLQEEPDPISKTIINKHKLALRKFSGVICKLLIRKNSGFRCSVCWDPIKRRKTVSSCDNCYGTGFEGGFFNPISIYVDFQPSAEVVEWVDFGKLEPNETISLTSNTPLLTPGDVIVRVKDNQRWIINDIRPRKFRASSAGTVVLIQVLRVGSVNKNDVIYRLDVS